MKNLFAFVLVFLFLSGVAHAAPSTVSISTQPGVQAAGNTPCNIGLASKCYYAIDGDAVLDSATFEVPIGMAVTVCYNANVAATSGVGRVVLQEVDTSTETEAQSTTMLGTTSGLLGASDQACMYEVPHGKYYVRVITGPGAGVIGRFSIRRQN